MKKKLHDNEVKRKGQVWFRCNWQLLLLRNKQELPCPKTLSFTS